MVTIPGAKTSEIILALTEWSRQMRNFFYKEGAGSYKPYFTFPIFMGLRACAKNYGQQIVLF